MLKRRALALSLILSLVSLPTFSQQSERNDDIRARIRKEGMEHSHILKTVHMLADVYGPRLTGADGAHRIAGERFTGLRSVGLDPEHPRHCAGEGASNRLAREAHAGSVE